MEQIKKGTTLTAINECIMDGTGHKVLTIGKKYEVEAVYLDLGDILIIDDDGEDHFYPFNTLKKYFDITDLCIPLNQIEP